MFNDGHIFTFWKLDYMKIFALITIIIFGFAISSCEYSKLPEPAPPEFCETEEVTYNNQVKEIIDKSCALSGCHLAGTKAPGDFTSYQNMGPYLKDSEFKFYVIDLKDDPDIGMPPDWDTNPGQKNLTPEQFEIIECWVNNNYSE